MPIALEFSSRVPVGKEVGEEEGKGNGEGCSPEGDSTGSFVLRLFSLSCRRESEGQSQGRVSVKYSSVLQVCPLRVTVSTDWSVLGQGSLVLAVGPGLAQLVLLFFWPEAEIQLRPRCYL